MDKLRFFACRYPLNNSAQQLNRFLESRLDTVRKHVQLLSQRSLSIVGRALVANALLLSRMWHCLRIVPVPVSFLQHLRSLVGRFIYGLQKLSACELCNTNPAPFRRWFVFIGSGGTALSATITLTPPAFRLSSAFDTIVRIPYS